MKKILFFFVLMGALATLIVSCKKDNSLDDLRDEEVRLLNEFIETNKITVEPTISGIYYIETEEGTGDTIKIGDRVKIFYTGMRVDSTIFDATTPFEPFEFYVGSTDVITGLSEGVGYMKQGGKATIIIPSNMAYGATTEYNLGISRFTTLIFDVELYSHYKTPTE